MMEVLIKIMDDTSDVVRVLIIAGGISIMVVLVGVLLVYTYLLQNSSRHEYSLLGNNATEGRINASTRDIPHEFLNDEESLRNLAETYDFTNLSPQEQEAYLQGQEFSKVHPPNFNDIRGKLFTTEATNLIKDYGVNAFQFEQEENLSPRYIVADKTELNFHDNDAPYSTATAILNYALPVKNRLYSDTIYWETKVFECNNTNNPNGHFSIGLVTKPYPLAFRLPGYNNFSIGYESTGNLKINKPFPTPLQQHQGEQSEYNALVLPPLQQSDIVGFGYVLTTGTIFITRNGKKLLDVMRGCFIDMYPAVGCFLTNAKFQVNLGQMGFVWIEANVRKYGFVSTSDYKKIKGDRGLASLPQYNKAMDNEEGDKILDKGEELPPRYPDDELDFFGRSSKDLVREGSSSKARKFDEEKKEKVDESSSTKVTDVSDEAIDLRERLYEQKVQSLAVSPVPLPLEVEEQSVPVHDSSVASVMAIKSVGPSTQSITQESFQPTESTSGSNEQIGDVNGVTGEEGEAESGQVEQLQKQAESSEPIEPVKPVETLLQSSEESAEPTENVSGSETTGESRTQSPETEQNKNTNKKKKKKAKKGKKKGKKK